jgi:RNA polymerase sigma factor (sigma-70 family)
MLRAAVGGERTAMAQLIHRYEPLLRDSVRRHLGPARFDREGEDLLQILRLAIVERLPSLQGRDRSSLTAWLKKVIRSRILDWEKSQRAARRSPTRPVVRLMTDAVGPSDSGPSPSRVVSDGEERGRFRRAIDRVPVRYRAVLRFLHENDPSPEEVAGFLRKSPEAARKFLSRALTHLRRLL